MSTADLDYPPGEHSRIRRSPLRAHYDRETVHAILDAGLLCHVGYVIDDQPYVTPTAYWRKGERVYWHGSSASKMLRHLKQGPRVCFTVSLMDGLVLARSGVGGRRDVGLAVDDVADVAQQAGVEDGVYGLAVVVGAQGGALDAAVFTGGIVDLRRAHGQSRAIGKAAVLGGTGGKLEG